MALKVVRLGTRDAPRRLRRFEREIELVSNLRHHGIVSVFDHGITNEGEPFLVMELIQGEAISFVPDASTEQRLRMFCQLCSAIRYAHQNGVVHRDIKPSNILVDAEGIPRVLDFGLATTVEARDTMTLTRSGEFVGTPIYAAPEQLRGTPGRADIRTDVYSLGIVLFHLLTGSHPFDSGSGPHDIVNGILERDPARPSTRINGLNHEVDTIVLKAIAREPQRRYANVDALQTDIERYLRGEPIEAKRDSTWYTLRKAARRHRWAVGAVASFLALLLTFSIVMSLLYRSARETSLELAHALATRDLDRGVELARGGDLAASEALLWNEYLQWVDHPQQLSEWSTGSLLQRRAHWGLWELYQRQPCLRTDALLAHPPTSVQIFDGELVVLVDQHLNVYHWRPQDGTHTRESVPDARIKPLLTHAYENGTRLLAGYADRLCVYALQPARPLLERVFDTRVTTISKPVRWNDGLHVVSGHEDGTARVWRLADGALVREIQLTPGPMHSLALTQSGELWGGEMRGDHFRVHDLLRGTTRDSNAASTRVWLSVADDGRYVHDRSIWGRDGSHLTRLEDQPIARVSAFVFGPGGRLVAGRGSTTPIWDTGSGALLRVLATPNENLVALDDEHDLLVTAHADGVVRAWDTRAGLGQRIIEAGGTTHCLAFAPDGRQLVFGGATSEVDALLQIGTGASAQSLADGPQHTKPVAAVGWLGADRWLSGGHDGRLLAWERGDQGWRAEEQLALPTAINDLAVGADGVVLLACNDGRVLRWDRRGPPRALGRQGFRVASVTIGPQGHPISGSSDGSVVEWGPDGARQFEGFRGTVRVVRSAPQPGYLAAGGDDQLIRIWDRNGRLLHEIATGVRVFALAFSPDGSLLASGDASGTIRLWDVPSGTELGKLRGHTHMVFTLAFAPDGHTLGSGAADGTTRCWDLRYFDAYLRGNLDYQAAQPRP